MLNNLHQLQSLTLHPENIPLSKTSLADKANNTTQTRALYNSITQPSHNSNTPTGAYRMLVARKKDARHRARSLAHRVYSGRGYVDTARPAYNPTPFDLQPETLVLLAEDQIGQDCGTVTLAYDTASNLPCDEIFSSELAELRARGKRTAEVTRLALAPTQGRSRLLLVKLFNLIYLHARHIMNCDEFLIEVNPRHVTYYRRLLGFTPVGQVRDCPRVQGAPAVLLSLDLSHAEKEIQRTSGQGGNAKERTLYPYFYIKAEEDRIVAFLKQANCKLELN